MTPKRRYARRHYFTIVQIKTIIISHAFTRLGGTTQGEKGQKWTYWLISIGTEMKMECIKFYEGNDGTRVNERKEN